VKWADNWESKLSTTREIKPPFVKSALEYGPVLDILLSAYLALQDEGTFNPFWGIRLQVALLLSRRPLYRCLILGDGGGALGADGPRFSRNAGHHSILVDTCLAGLSGLV